MSGAKHTPGPWMISALPEDVSVSVDDAPTYQATAVGPAGRFPVALVVTLGWDEAKLQANAQLLAAVPDLLEALANVVSELDWQLLTEGDVVAERAKRHAELLYAAEAALAKARGES